MKDKTINRINYWNMKGDIIFVQKNQVHRFVVNDDVKVYADRMHLSKKAVNQFTRNVTGLSAKQFIINRLVLEIKRYLSQGELLNYEIADLLGFDEAANMSRFFKHYEGMSPKEFRESLNE